MKDTTVDKIKHILMYVIVLLIMTSIYLSNEQLKEQQEISAYLLKKNNVEQIVLDSLNIKSVNIDTLEI